MASVAEAESARRTRSLAPDLLEKAIAGGAVAMLVLLIAALAFGFRSWNRIPLIVWLHMATIATALALTPLLMLRKRGTRVHRRIGWVWAIAMAATAAFSLFIGGFSDGHWSWIHILSVATLAGVYGLIRTARAHLVARHRRIVRALSGGALLLAGVFTLIPTRTLGHFLFG